MKLHQGGHEKFWPVPRGHTGLGLRENEINTKYTPPKQTRRHRIVASAV